LLGRQFPRDFSDLKADLFLLVQLLDRQNYFSLEIQEDYGKEEAEGEINGGSKVVQTLMHFLKLVVATKHMM
jgi:hypothetical protein